MNKVPKPSAKPAAQKTPNRKSVPVNTSKETSHTKENPANQATAATPSASGRRPLEEVTDEANNLEIMNRKMLEMQAALEKAEAEKEALAQKLADSTSDTVEPSGGEEDTVGDTSAGSAKKKKQVKIPRPTGDFNIQDAMGLGGSAKRRQKYNAILRVVKELAGNARLNWELEWAEIPVRAKAQFFEVVRESIPDMARYANDWATEAIVRQWMKNKRSYAVQKGFLEVKPKWEYLKGNAAKRTNAPRGNGKRKATSQSSSRPTTKKARLAKTSVKAKGKGKSRARVVDDGDDDDEEDEEEQEGAGGEGGDENEEDDE